MSLRKGQGGKKASRKSAPDKQTTRNIIRELFDRQPVNDAELKRRFAPLPADLARQALVDMLDDAQLDPSDGALFEAAVEVVGLGSERERVINMVGRPGLPAELRIVALNLLDESDRQRAAPLLRTLPEEEQSQLFWAPLRELMVSLKADPDAAHAVVDILTDVSEEEREDVLGQVGYCRRQCGTPAVAAYRMALRCNEISQLHQRMVDAVVSEGGGEGIALLQELRDEETNEPPQRKMLQRALLQLCTRAIEPIKPQIAAPEGQAYISSCDGQGTYALLGYFENPDGSATLSSMCIRVHGELRDALVLPQFSHAELQPFLDRYCEGAQCELVEISLNNAAQLAGETAAQTRKKGRGLPAEAPSALALFGRYPGAAMPRIDTPTDGGVEANSRAAIESLLDRPEYESWFFDAGDLESAGIQPNGLNDPPTAAKTLDSEPMRRRLAGMASHMSTWHVLRDELDAAAVCSAAALAARDRFSDCDLVQVMLERSNQRLHDDGEDVERTFERALGNPMVRRDLRARFFAEVTDPRGRHIARLDFAEAALMSLDEAVATLPGHRRPQSDQIVAMAYVFAETFARLQLSPKTMERKNWPAELAEGLMELAPLSGEEAAQLMASVLSDLDVFVEQVCSGCPLACLERPGAGVADEFYATAHPAELGGTGDDAELGSQSAPLSSTKPQTAIRSRKGQGKVGEATQIRPTKRGKKPAPEPDPG